jgi:transcriptional regulator with PAS, ATPase and Fis domain
VPATLLESELFGYEPGAFTGAKAGGRVGKFELAEGGTVLLDEIGDMPLDLQPKLLRVLNDHKVTRIGGRAPKQLDFRLISCSNRDIKAMAKAGTFREDLYFRISGAEVTLPPLARRMEHFDKLVGLFFRKHGREKRVVLPEETRARLRHYGWPGNIRELEKVIQYLIAVKPEGQIQPYDLPNHILHFEAEGKAHSLKALMRMHERAMIIQSLGKHGHNVTETAKALKISRRALQMKMKSGGIKKDERE